MGHVDFLYIVEGTGTPASLLKNYVLNLHGKYRY
jgi:hypothetical protein